MASLPRYGHWESTGTFNIAVVGTSHHRSEIASIAQNPLGINALVVCIAYLVPDNQNPHDLNAVRVVIEGQTVGYLSRDFAKRYRLWISGLPGHIQQVSVAAAITNGLQTGDKAYEYTIELDIPDSLKIYQLNEPLNDEPTRVNGYVPLSQSADGSYVAKVWVPVADFSELHKSRRVEELDN